MPVRWQRVPIAFNRGLETKQDEKQVVPGALTVLENGVFTTPGEINKRNGLTSWSRTVLGSGSIASGSALCAYDDETLLFTGEDVYSRLQSTGSWLHRGRAVAAFPTTTSVLRNTYAQYNAVSAVSGGLELYAWEDSRIGVRCSVVDSNTGGVILSDVVCSGGFDPLNAGQRACAVQCFAHADGLYVAYHRGGDNINPGTSRLRYRRIALSSPSTLGEETEFSTDVNIISGEQYGGGAIHRLGGTWDILPLAGSVYMVHASRNTGSTGVYGRIAISKFDGPSLTYTTGVFPGGLSEPSNRARVAGGPVSAWSDPSGNLWWAARSASLGGPFYGGVVSTNLSTVVTESIIGYLSLPARAPDSAGGVWLSGSTSRLYVALSGTNTLNVTQSLPGGAGYLISQNITDRVIDSVTWGASQLPATASFARGVTLASKPFRRGNTHYVWTLHDSEMQPTYFLLDGSGSVVCKSHAGVAGNMTGNRCLPAPAQLSGDVWTVAAGRKSAVLSVSGSLLSLPGVSSIRVDFSTASVSFPSARLGRSLLTAGGLVSSYDRLGFTEHGFHLYPDLGRGLGPGASTADYYYAASSTLGNGDLTPGTYSYVATYEWIDNFGQVHRSVPSLPLTASLTGTGSITLRIPTLRLTSKEQRSPVFIGLYRTEPLGDVFYKVTSPLAPLWNTSSIDRVSFRDTLSNAELISREILYTDSGELPNDPPPVARYLCTWKSRAWLAGLEDENVLRYSKLVDPDTAIGFSDLLEVRMDPYGGAITALAALDDKLVVFKEDAIHVVYPLTGDGTPYGGGPDNTGTGGEFGQQVLATDVGCVSARSVVVTDAGVLFKSAKGIYLLSRQLQVRYVGAPVERYNDLEITSATLVAYANQVRFTTSTSVCLVYDYLVDAWTTFTNHQAAASTIEPRSGRFALLRGDGTVAVDTSGSYTDDGAEVKLRLVTGWLSFAGLAGFQRVKRIQALGGYEGAHLLSASVAVDYGPPSQEVTLDATRVNGGSNMYLFDLHLQRQKCTALQLSLQDTPSGSAGRGLSLADMTVDVGVKEGAVKVAGDRRGPLS